MKQRCKNRNDRNYKYYGSRGIDYCPTWEQFSAFFADMGECPPGLTLERIDNDKGYHPGNCKWASYSDQMNNKRGNVKISYNGKTQTLTQWARDVGIDKQGLQYRLDQGWPLEKAFAKKKKNLIEFNGLKLSPLGWSRRLGIPRATISTRLKLNWSIEEALTK
jgi:hypothetical protein